MKLFELYKKEEKCKFLYILFALVLLFILIFAAGENITGSEVGETDFSRGMVVRVEGTITSGTARMLRNSLEEAEQENYDFLLVELDTPGGVLDPTLKIMSDFLEANLPIITYVSPSGAISASAGSFLLLSGHKAVMTPGTSTGAAMPVQFSPGGTQDAADEKTINFLEGHIRSIARERDRNEEVAGKFVTENLTLTADEALEEGIIDSINRTRQDLLASLDGEEVMIRGEARELRTAGAELTERDMDIWERVENILGNPQVTFILMLVGIYGVIIGFSSPGTFVPEVGGVIAIILALYGLGIIEVDYVGILLVGLGIFFLIVELFTPTFGIFTTIGVVLLVLGGFIFPGEPLMPPEWFSNFRMLVLGIAAMSVVFILIALKKILNLSRAEVKHGENRYKNKRARVISEINPRGQIRIEGEIWQARTEEGKIAEGENVKVVGREDMILVVKKLNSH